MININRVSLYADDGRVEARQCWKEIAACRYQLMASELMRCHAPHWKVTTTSSPPSSSAPAPPISHSHQPPAAS
jgi:hypothetical protein